MKDKRASEKDLSSRTRVLTLKDTDEVTSTKYIL